MKDARLVLIVTLRVAGVARLGFFGRFNPKSCDSGYCQCRSRSRKTSFFAARTEIISHAWERHGSREGTIHAVVSVDYCGPGGRLVRSR